MSAKLQKKPTVKQLARLTAMLASHQMPNLTGELGRANLAQWIPPTGDAIELWRSCQRVIVPLSAKERRGLRVDELAALAATLAQGTNLREGKSDSFAVLALRLWQRCRVQLENSTGLEKVVAECIPEHPVPGGKYPVPLKTALRYWMPKKTHFADRLRFFRRYLRESVYSYVSDEDHIARPNDELACESDAANEIARLTADGLTKEIFKRDDRFFPRWLDEYQALQRKQRARRGGDAKARNARNERASQFKETH